VFDEAVGLRVRQEALLFVMDHTHGFLSDEQVSTEIAND